MSPESPLTISSSTEPATPSMPRAAMPSSLSTISARANTPTPSPLMMPPETKSPPKSRLFPSASPPISRATATHRSSLTMPDAVLSDTSTTTARPNPSGRVSGSGELMPPTRLLRSDASPAAPARATESWFTTPQIRASGLGPISELPDTPTSHTATSRTASPSRELPISTATVTTTCWSAMRTEPSVLPSTEPSMSSSAAASRSSAEPTSAPIMTA